MTTFSRGNVGWAVQFREPSRPFSSASQKANRIDRFGGSGEHGEGLGQLEDGRGAAGVVVGAVVDLANRAAAVAPRAVANVVVMGTDDDHLALEFGIASGEQRENVAIVGGEGLKEPALDTRPPVSPSSASRSLR